MRDVQQTVKGVPISTSPSGPPDGVQEPPAAVPPTNSALRDSVFGCCWVGSAPSTRHTPGAFSGTAPTVHARSVLIVTLPVQVAPAGDAQSQGRQVRVSRTSE
jgi:hypothetical protein